MEEGDAMRLTNIIFGLLLLALSGCNTGSRVTSTTPPIGDTSPRDYNGSATVGDFLTISVDPGNNTISYQNLSNGDSETFPFTVQNDGAFAISDPTGNLTRAYEVPNYAILVEANK